MKPIIVMKSFISVAKADIPIGQVFKIQSHFLILMSISSVPTSGLPFIKCLAFPLSVIISCSLRLHNCKGYKKT